ncbi:hypothetical protein GCM10023215_39410 [Pseudonocardia yuanmonensis]|uniref:Uncharacterized protein n=1 Tax=Pseudonocardia yuanmonensis TaxID=1095914 RepID=A0ABP8WZL8_9PSEU
MRTIIRPGEPATSAILGRYAVDREQQSAFAAGVAACLGWVRGGRVAPVRERDESPVTRELATAEMWACAAAATPGIPPPPLEEICAELGVRNWPVLPAGVGWAEGGEVCLRWLLGRRTGRRCRSRSALLTGPCRRWGS